MINKPPALRDALWYAILTKPAEEELRGPASQRTPSLAGRQWSMNFSSNMQLPENSLGSRTLGNETKRNRERQELHCKVATFNLIYP